MAHRGRRLSGVSQVRTQWPIVRAGLLDGTIRGRCRRAFGLGRAGSSAPLWMTGGSGTGQHSSFSRTSAKRPGGAGRSSKYATNEA